MEPPNDNRTEQWLQAYARRRRERAGEAESMHEATRRMLLDEAKREWGAKGEAAEAKEPAQEESPWARWAWAGTVMAAVLVAARAKAKVRARVKPLLFSGLFARR